MVFERNTEPVPMAFSGIEFCAHEGYWMFNTVEEIVQVRPDIGPSNVLIVPIPNGRAGRLPYCLRPNISGNT